ncbi:MocR-like pyridoxine biosynthesis transcription factor PdxR [Parasporobacterium paucivorans]|uniref:GntR family transcriptional regulator / MocR family aminotransferase n=1 Tax=Parasporobacterium paucivorans DSM 15970 TaxID=1122934 RepID=A0A1M6FTA5_9FIRM|nr:PLP-dependent aminotransferase family protein [Parasporobacterium paucivorans]SHJ00859.1 GntR family transcriptional regulator / MocR family aminotransferase [Parasporobacterium paucivorans DSM 15970]
MKELTISLNTGSDIPMYGQIYTYIKEEIRKGRIRNGEQLPSARALSRHLSVSRSTVDMAYLQLQSEGYIDSLPRKGYYVSDINLLHGLHDALPGNLFEEKPIRSEAGIDFSPRGIDLSYFPFNAWRKISKNILSADNPELFKTGNPKGDRAFRQTIARYLFEARGVRTEADRIILGAGNEYLLLLLNQILGGERNIAMENPTYTQAYRVFLSLGQKIVPVDMDGQGINIRELAGTMADTVYVMPSHHYPMGIVMPIGRRLELLKWSAGHPDRYIIEDDYDSEFRYKGKPIPALKSLDEKDSVIYIGTFSKSISPALRMSYMVLPARLMKIYQKKLSFYSSSVSSMDQAIVNEFITGGQFERHLNRMRSIYKNKHDLLANELKKINRPVRILGENSGLHILLETDSELNEECIMDMLLKEGVRIYGLSEYYIRPPAQPYKSAFILGYANLTDKQILKGVSEIKKVLEAVR